MSKPLAYTSNEATKPSLYDDGALVGSHAQQQAILFGGETVFPGTGNQHAFIIRHAKADN
jgi:hypothetical protein